MSNPLLLSRYLTTLSLRSSATAGTVSTVRVIRVQPPPRWSSRHYATGSSTQPAASRRCGRRRRAAGQNADDGDEFDLMNTLFPVLQSSGSILKTALGISAGLGTIFLAGGIYLEWYKSKVLDRIEQSFAPGYDPALALANLRQSARPSVAESIVDGDIGTETDWMHRPHRRHEQDAIDAIIDGSELGHYFMLLGPKGVGKGTMIIDAMNKVNADGVSMVEAHPDLEVFRLRLGKTLDFEYSEDSQTGVFQRRDPREGGPCLDIERALNKLEKVALRVAQKKGRPLVMIFNNIHYFNNDDEGRNLLLQLQQKAELWAQSGCMTVVFSSDDSWPQFFLRKTASRMQTISIPDLDKRQAIAATIRMHKNASRPTEDLEAYETVIDLVGGRLSYLKKIAYARDMNAAARRLISHEKGWLLSQIGLIPDHDDDVMDEQKWSSCSWLLLREFVKIRQQQEKEREEKIAAGDQDVASQELPLPSIPYFKCRQIMTRPDFLEQLDRLNIINIDVHHDVRPDSALILHAAQEACEEDGFDDVLDNVRDRVDEIESLHRTRELTVKDVERSDLIRLVKVLGGSSPSENSDDTESEKPRLV